MRHASHQLLAVAALFVAAPLGAQSHPNLTGTWVLDSSKTQADGNVVPPTSSTYILVQHGDTLTQDSKVSDGRSGEFTEKMFWLIDGKAWVNHNAFGTADFVSTSQLKWDGPALKIITSFDVEYRKVERSETWTLGSDGKTLTIKMDISTDANYTGSNTLVFNKQ